MKLIWRSYEGQLRGCVENSRHPKTAARGLGETELLLRPFPGNPGNPRMNSKNEESGGGLHFSSIPGLRHWKFRLDVRNLGQTLDISAGRSKSRPGEDGICPDSYKTTRDFEMNT